MPRRNAFRASFLPPAVIFFFDFIFCLVCFALDGRHRAQTTDRNISEKENQNIFDVVRFAQASAVPPAYNIDAIRTIKKPYVTPVRVLSKNERGGERVNAFRTIIMKTKKKKNRKYRFVVLLSRTDNWPAYGLRAGAASDPTERSARTAQSGPDTTRLPYEHGRFDWRPQNTNGTVFIRIIIRIVLSR